MNQKTMTILNIKNTTLSPNITNIHNITNTKRTSEGEDTEQRKREQRRARDQEQRKRENSPSARLGVQAQVSFGSLTASVSC